jgi:hypothetical protein
MQKTTKHVVNHRLFQEPTLFELVDRVLAQHFAAATQPPKKDCEES